MNSKERIEAAFKKEKTDKIPINHRGFSSKVASYILGREAFVGGGIQQWREAKSLWEGWHDKYLEKSFKDATEISLVTKQDMMRSCYWRYNIKPTKKLDEYAYLYEYGEEKNWKVLRYDPVSEQANFFSYHPRELTLEDIKKGVEEGGKNLSSYKPKEEDYSFQIKAQRIYGKEKVVEVGGIAVGIPITEANIWLQAMLTLDWLKRISISRQKEPKRI